MFLILNIPLYFQNIWNANDSRYRREHPSFDSQIQILDQLHSILIYISICNLGCFWGHPYQCSTLLVNWRSKYGWQCYIYSFLRVFTIHNKHKLHFQPDNCFCYGCIYAEYLFCYKVNIKNDHILRKGMEISSHDVASIPFPNCVHCLPYQYVCYFLGNFVIQYDI